ncbi:MAG: hypothetical protein IT340_14590 [Chloroflexi bacterium]|nr:hypothetical protein [Chloroflexota bacterium]
MQGPVAPRWQPALARVFFLAAGLPPSTSAGGQTGAAAATDAIGTVDTDANRRGWRG